MDLRLFILLLLAGVFLQANAAASDGDKTESVNSGRISEKKKELRSSETSEAHHKSAKESKEHSSSGTKSSKSSSVSESEKRKGEDGERTSKRVGVGHESSEENRSKHREANEHSSKGKKAEKTSAVSESEKTRGTDEERSRKSHRHESNEEESKRAKESKENSSAGKKSSKSSFESESERRKSKDGEGTSRHRQGHEDESKEKGRRSKDDNEHSSEAKRSSKTTGGADSERSRHSFKHESNEEASQRSKEAKERSSEGKSNSKTSATSHKEKTTGGADSDRSKHSFKHEANEEASERSKEAKERSSEGKSSSKTSATSGKEKTTGGASSDRSRHSFKHESNEEASDRSKEAKERSSEGKSSSKSSVTSENEKKNGGASSERSRHSHMHESNEERSESSKESKEHSSGRKTSKKISIEGERTKTSGQIGGQRRSSCMEEVDDTCDFGFYTPYEASPADGCSLPAQRCIPCDADSKKWKMCSTSTCDTDVSSCRLTSLMPKKVRVDADTCFWLCGACPEPVKAQCPPAFFNRLVESELECLRYVCSSCDNSTESLAECEASTTPVCSQKPSVESCGPGRLLVEDNSDPCPKFTCKTCDTEDIVEDKGLCRRYTCDTEMPDCLEGLTVENITVEVDGVNSCFWRCLKAKSCPQEVVADLCADGFYTDMTVDEDGCSKPSCRPCTDEDVEEKKAGCFKKPSCPIPRVICGSGHLVAIDRTGECPRYSCKACDEKDIVEDKAECRRATCDTETPECHDGFSAVKTTLIINATETCFWTCVVKKSSATICPEIQPPQCPLGQIQRFKTIGTSDCPTAACEDCTAQDLAGDFKEQCSRFSCDESAASASCPDGYRLARWTVKTAEGVEVCYWRCEVEKKIECPPVDPVRCPPGMISRMNLTALCPHDFCDVCTEEDLDSGLKNMCDAYPCSRNTRLECPEGFKPSRLTMKSSEGSERCFWICRKVDGCPKAKTCKFGFYSEETLTDGCLRRSCRRCDASHSALAGCQTADRCPAIDWSRRCPPNHFRELHMGVATDCALMGCYHCNVSEEDLPDCKKTCPKHPNPTCSAGQVLDKEFDSEGCAKPKCRKCLTPKECGDVEDECAELYDDQEAADCKKGFYIQQKKVRSCSVKFCVPCTSQDASRPECSGTPSHCESALIPHCSSNEEFVQLVSNSCPVLACRPCAIPAFPDCSAAQGFILKATRKMFGCPAYKCEEMAKVTHSGCPLEEKDVACPENFKKVKTVVDGCGFFSCLPCERPDEKCPEGQEMRQKNSETCEMACMTTPVLPAQTVCTLKKPKDVIFVLDVAAFSSPFLLEFEYKSAISRLAGRFNYGENVRFGFVNYGNRVEYVAWPEECHDLETLMQKLLTMRYHRSTGFAVDAALESILQYVKTQSTASRDIEIVHITNGIAKMSAEVSDLTREISKFVSKSYVIVARALVVRREFYGLASIPSLLTNVMSMWNIFPTIKQLVFTDCNLECTRQKLRSQQVLEYLKFVRTEVSQLEALSSKIMTKLSTLQLVAENAQYWHESKKMRLETCSALVIKFQRSIAHLEQQIRAVSTTTKNQAIQIDSSITERIQALEMTLKTLTKKKVELEKQLTTFQLTVRQEEEKMLTMKKLYEQKLKAADAKIVVLQKKIQERWEKMSERIQVLTKLNARLTQRKAELQEKKVRVEELMQTNSELKERIVEVSKKVSVAENKTTTEITESYEKFTTTISSCQSAASSKGFLSLVNIVSGQSVDYEDIVKVISGEAVDMQSSFNISTSSVSSSINLLRRHLFQTFRLSFTARQGEEVAFIIFKANSRGFFEFNYNLVVESSPWSTDELKEFMSAFPWQLKSRNAKNHFFQIGDDQTACDSRSCVMSLVTAEDPCLPGESVFPKILVSTSTTGSLMSHMTSVHAMTLSAKPVIPAVILTDALTIFSVSSRAAKDVPMLWDAMEPSDCISNPAAGYYYRCKLMQKSLWEKNPLFKTLSLEIETASEISLLTFNITFSKVGDKPCNLLRIWMTRGFFMELSEQTSLINLRVAKNSEDIEEFASRGECQKPEKIANFVPTEESRDWVKGESVNVFNKIRLMVKMDSDVQSMISDMINDTMASQRRMPRP